MADGKSDTGSEQSITSTVLINQTRNMLEELHQLSEENRRKLKKITEDANLNMDEMHSRSKRIRRHQSRKSNKRIVNVPPDNHSQMRNQAVTNISRNEHNHGDHQQCPQIVIRTRQTKTIDESVNPNRLKRVDRCVGIEISNHAGTQTDDSDTEAGAWKQAHRNTTTHDAGTSTHIENDDEENMMLDDSCDKGIQINPDVISQGVQTEHSWMPQQQKNTMQQPLMISMPDIDHQKDQRNDLDSEDRRVELEIAEIEHDRRQNYSNNQPITYHHTNQQKPVNGDNGNNNNNNNSNIDEYEMKNDDNERDGEFLNEIRSIKPFEVRNLFNGRFLKFPFKHNSLGMNSPGERTVTLRIRGSLGPQLVIKHHNGGLFRNKTSTVTINVTKIEHIGLGKTSQSFQHFRKGRMVTEESCFSIFTSHRSWDFSEQTMGVYGRSRRMDLILPIIQCVECYSNRRAEPQNWQQMLEDNPRQRLDIRFV